MTNSLYIGKLIYKLLTENNDLKDSVGVKVYPLVADNNVTYPYIVYQRLNAYDVGNGTKDGYGQDDVSFQINIVSNKYEESIDIAHIARLTLEKGLKATLNSSTEDYQANAFIQHLSFNCKIN